MADAPPTTTSSGGSGADAAGGEAIYSSDGLPPLPAPAPPIKQHDNANAEDAILDTQAVSATDAFEVFGGKAYFSSGGEAAGGRRPKFGFATGITEDEAPLVRLARLRAEVDELERDLASSSDTAAAAAGDETGGGGTVSTEELSKLARELSARLEVAGNKHGVVGGGSSSLFRGPQDNLTQLVRAELAKLNEKEATAAEGTGSGDDSTKAGVVYELYASSSTGHVNTGTTDSSSGPSAAAAASLEERLGRIERAVGAQSSSLSAAAAGSALGGSSGGRSVLERLEEAERSVRNVDAKSLEMASGRAKVIRADLEAAAKAKTKLSAALSTLSADDARTISSLHEQLQDLEGISDHLPAIISRLQDLSSLHLQASTFASRLTAVENAATETERLLRGIEDAVTKVEEGWKANAAAVEGNVAALDERIKSLS